MLTVQFTHTPTRVFTRIGCIALACVFAPSAHSQLASSTPGAVAAQRTVRAESIVHGLARSMDNAARMLASGKERFQGIRSLDDARRVARILRDVAPPNDHAMVRFGLQAVKNARHAVQNGDPQAAAQILRSARDQLLSRSSGRGKVGSPVDSSAVGKLVVNAEGKRIGRVDRLEQTSPGVQFAVLKVGGLVDLFGFLDLGNELVGVPAEQLVVGKRMVALRSAITPEQAENLPRFGSASSR